MKKVCLIFILFILLTARIFSQDGIKSVEEDYYDFLVLNGITSRNYINYRTLTDNIYDINETSDGSSVFESFPWKKENLGLRHQIFNFNKESENWFVKGIDKSLNYKIHGLEYFSSYNTNYPFGQNDADLWQGRGFNMNLSLGASLSGYGFDLVLKPVFLLSQNKAYEIMAASGSGISEYGYFWGNGHVDAPQRFGSDLINAFSWGDSEARYSYRAFTIGFGTQSVWIGPARENSIMLSNNAPVFPKLDFGFKKTEILLPKLNYSLGFLELRLYYGYLSESDFFDSKSENDHNLLSGVTFSYSPAWEPLKGLSLGFTKICLSKWGDNVLEYINPFYKDNNWQGETLGEDQYAALSFDWLLSSFGLEIYGEIALDDQPAAGYTFYEYARWPFHAVAYTLGLKKSIKFSQEKKVYGLFNFEWNTSEASPDYQFWPGSSYNFGFHSLVTQGKTNRGQWLGSGYGYGGNTQILSFTVYSKHGFDKIILGRNNPDNSYIWNMAVEKRAQKDLLYYYFASQKANFYAGYESMWFILPQLRVGAGFLYNLIINPFYEKVDTTKGYTDYSVRHYANNFRFTLNAKYSF